MAAFSDLHVAVSNKNELSEIFQTAISLGYDILGVNTFLTELRGKDKKQQQPLKPAEVVPLSEQTQQLLKMDIPIPFSNITGHLPSYFDKLVEGRKMRQISRLTALLEETTSAHKLASAEVQVFDLLSVQPSNEAAFKLACTALEVDIIVLNMTEKLPFYLKRPLVNAAIERGIHFEILYSPAVRDSTCRQNTISNALQLFTASKGKNIIISSGCEKAIDLRGPYDITNLGLLFGLSSPQSKDAVSKNCRAVLKHAEARKIAKSVVGVVKSSQLAAGDQWILASNKHSLTSEDSPALSTDKERTAKKMKVELA